MKTKRIFIFVGSCLVIVVFVFFPKLIYRAGDLFFYMKQPKIAVGFYNRAEFLKIIWPKILVYKETEFHTHRGIALMNMGQYQQAESDLDKAIALDPKNVIAFDYLGVLGILFNKYDIAITYLDKAIEIDPNSSSSYVNRGFCHAKLNHFSQAQKDLNKALELEPNNPETLYSIAQFYDKFNMLKAAVKYYTRFIKISKPDHDGKQITAAQRIADINAMNPADIPKVIMTDVKISFETESGTKKKSKNGSKDRR